MRSLLILILFSITLASPAYALTIQGASPAQESVIEQQWEKLNPCIQSHIEAEGLSRIKILSHNSLKGWSQPNNEPDACVEPGEVKRVVDTYYVHAQSLMYKGKIVIDEKTVTPEIVMHELGHWFGHNVVERDYYHAWRQALDLDFKQMGQCPKYDNDYLQSPYEAEAEIFAAQFVDGLKMYPDAKVAFPHASAMMAEILAKTCPE